MTVQTLVLAACFAGLIVACSSDRARQPASSSYQGSRSYKLDPESSGVRVGVFGAGMGTPDADKIELLLRSLKSAGEFSSLVLENTGIEGGFTMCGKFSDAADQSAIFDLLRSIETDAKETHFSATSVSACTSQNL